ncbi:MAG: TetR/AcrR family transcriptional regulator [Hyphomonadaceae bacterium]
MPTPRRWTRRAEARPEEILEAALDEFSERGFDAARMEDVARRAGLSKAGVYLYFESKEALLKALIEAKVAPLAHQARALADAGMGDPLLALRMFARVGVERIRDPRLFGVPRLVISLSGRFPEVAEHYRRNVVEIALGALTRLVEAAAAEGQIRAVEPRAAARAFIGPIFFEAMWAHVLRGETALDHPEKLIESHFDILLKGLEPRA